MRYPISAFLIAIALIVLSASPTYASVIGKPTNNLGLIGYWPMNESAGGIVPDKSGFGNFGTTTNNPTWVNGKFGNALSFAGNGPDQSVQMGNLTSMNSLSAITVSAWIRSVGPGGQAGAEAHIVDKSDCHGALNDGDFELLQNAGTGLADFAVYIGGAVQDTLSGSTGNSVYIDDGNWHFLTGTYD